MQMKFCIIQRVMSPYLLSAFKKMLENWPHPSDIYCKFRLRIKDEAPEVHRKQILLHFEQFLEDMNEGGDEIGMFPELHTH